MTAVHVVTGFLGSGKTTLIAHLLRDPGLADTAVIVNEFGAVGLDHALIEAVDQDVILLSRGCVCCTLNGSLASTLEGLALRRATGKALPFQRVVIETTGLADPAPVLQAVLDRPAVMQGFRLARVVTVVDAMAGGTTLDRHPEALRQVAVADLLLLSKTDLAGPAPALQTRLGILNPRAPIMPILHGAMPAALLLNEAAHHTRRSSRVADAGHTARIATTVVDLPDKVAFDTLADWLGGLAAAHGTALLRVKGIVGVLGQDRPLVVHGVQHVFHPPRLLPAWPPGIAPGLVFILDGLDPAAIHASAEAAGLTRRVAA